MKTSFAYPVGFLTPVFLVLIFGIPLQFAVFPVLMAPTWSAKAALLLLLPFVFSLAFVGVSAALSWPFQRHIVPGKFPRLLSDKVYGPRRLYGLCWCAVYYFTPLYYLLFSVPSLRKFLLRAFGYRGHDEVTIAPDVWLRDLPLLRFDRGSYVANKATVGTNICLADGSILVGPVTLGANALVGHMTMLAPGCQIGERTEIGVGCGIGIRAEIGAETRIGPTSTVNHGARIGAKVDVGTFSYLGVKCEIADGLHLPSGSNIPEGAKIATQAEVREYVSSESRNFRAESDQLRGLYTRRRSDDHRMEEAPDGTSSKRE